MSKYCSDCKFYDLSHCKLYNCIVDKNDSCDNWCFKSLGVSGVANQKLELFIDRHKWKLAELPSSTHKVSVSLPIVDYYNLGLLCIKDKKSIKSFIQEAVYEKMREQKKKSVKSNNNIVQGSLF